MRSVSPRNRYIIYSTKVPPSVQRVPWPVVQDEGEAPTPNKNDDYYNTWVLNDEEMPWLVDSDGTRLHDFRVSRSSFV